MVHDELVIEAKDDLVKDIAKTVSLCMIEAGEEFIKSVPVEVNIVVEEVEEIIMSDRRVSRKETQGQPWNKVFHP